METLASDSQQLCRSLPSGGSINLDTTYKLGLRMNVRPARSADSLNNRDVRVGKAGIASIYSANDMILAWQVNADGTGATLQALLDPFMRRMELMQDQLLAVTTDNTKAFGNLIINTAKKYKRTLHCQEDVPHVIRRYAACIHDGQRNTNYNAIKQEISAAFYLCYATKEMAATYRTPDDQATRLEAAFVRWTGHWCKNAELVHHAQLKLVRSGHCSHRFGNVPTVQSPLEGSHKYWGMIGQNFSGGVQLLVQRSHLFVLARNVRVALANLSASAFLKSTYGCYHLSLVSCTTALESACSGLPAPHFVDIASGEKFGLVSFTHIPDQIEIEELPAQDEIAAKMLEYYGLDPNVVQPAASASASYVRPREEEDDGEACERPGKRLRGGLLPLPGRPEPSTAIAAAAIAVRTAAAIAVRTSASNTFFKAHTKLDAYRYSSQFDKADFFLLVQMRAERGLFARDDTNYALFANEYAKRQTQGQESPRWKAASALKWQIQILEAICGKKAMANECA